MNNDLIELIHPAGIRVRKAVLRLNITTVAELLQKKNELMAVRNFGKLSMKKLENRLQELNLQWNQRTNTNDELQCRCCDQMFTLRPNQEPTAWCDDCAQALCVNLLEACQYALWWIDASLDPEQDETLVEKQLRAVIAKTNEIKELRRRFLE